MKTTILFTNWGPHVWHDGEYVTIHSINPEHQARWFLTRKEMLIMAWRLVVAAFRMKAGDQP